MPARNPPRWANHAVPPASPPPHAALLNVRIPLRACRTIQNPSTGPATLSQFGITWPTSNGGLKQVSMDGYLYTGPTITGGSATFTSAMLGNASLRTIDQGQSEKLRIIFEKTASTNKALYTSVAEFNTGCFVNLFA